MRYLLVLVIVGVAVYTSAGQTVCDRRIAPVGETYSFCVPGDWISRDRPPFDIFFKTKDSGPDRFSLSVSKRYASSNIDGIKAIAFDEVRNAYDSVAYPNINLKRIEDLKGLPLSVGYRLLFEIDSPAGKRLRMIEFLLPYGEEVLIFRSQFPAMTGAEAEADTALVEDVVRTVRYGPRNPPTPEPTSAPRSTPSH